MHTRLAGPILEGERLRLRPPQPEDFEGFAAFHGDAETMRFLGGVQSPAIAHRSMRYMAGQWLMDGFSMFSIIEKASGQWIGRAGPIRPYAWPGLEVGWGLLSSAWGRGYAFEATALAIDFAFDVLAANEVVHTIAADNVASARLAEKLGARNAGPVTLPAPYVDTVVDLWKQGRDDWQVNRLKWRSHAGA